MVDIETASSAGEEEFYDACDRVARPQSYEQEGAARAKGKGKAIVSFHHELPSDEVGVDWKQYEPPLALSDTPGVESEIILQLIADSIERIKTRIAREEDEKKQVMEEEAAAGNSTQEQDVQKVAGTDKAPETTDIVIQDEGGHASDGPVPSQEPENRSSNAYAYVMARRTLGGGDPLDALHALNPKNPDVGGTLRRHGPPAILHTGPKSRPKRRLFLSGLLRRLNDVGIQPESSAAGSARPRPPHAPSSFERTSDVLRHRLKKPSVDNRSRESHADTAPTWSVEEDEVECVSCLDDFKPQDTVKAPCHRYCKPCFSRLVASACANEQHWPPKCCLNPIPHQTVVLELEADPALRQRYRECAAQYSVPVGERVYCHQSDCGQWLRPGSQIDRASEVGRCAAGHATCLVCRGAQHLGSPCPQDRELQRTRALAEEEGWRRCVGCRAYVEHASACQHMTCRCGAEFCYVCGARWRTCACTMDMLAAAKGAAAGRRRAREQREAREEAEAREALRLVREFEREEARRAELKRQQAAEARRHTELVRRVEQETRRRAGVAAKFRDLREQLERVHERQRSLLAREHERRDAERRAQADAALARLRREHATARGELRARAVARVGARERAAEMDYAARLEDQRRIEERYRTQLQTYWAGRRGRGGGWKRGNGDNGDDGGDGDGAAEMMMTTRVVVSAALAELREKMEAGSAAWRAHAEAGLARYRLRVDEEREIREELLDDAERMLVEGLRGTAAAWARRRGAEGRWVGVVVDERARVLGEMETAEMEEGGGGGGEDIGSWFAGEGGLGIEVDEINGDEYEDEDGPPG
ncbi:hypothetical protein F4778DRAFT_793316 [Xylariomycetidae sp. FL2044]|nr:hypothetical protein F4778DRAFT_793316 [Xylariomycetidae sp. FL2044]